MPDEPPVSTTIFPLSESSFPGWYWDMTEESGLGIPQARDGLYTWKTKRGPPPSPTVGVLTIISFYYIDLTEEKHLQSPYRTPHETDNVSPQSLRTVRDTDGRHIDTRGA